MQKWEYCLIDILPYLKRIRMKYFAASGFQEKEHRYKGGDDTRHAGAAMVTQLGLEGWEIVSTEGLLGFDGGNNHICIIFKRPL